MRHSPSHSTKRNAQSSFLLRLPAELRTEIYTYALSGNTFLLKERFARSPSQHQPTEPKSLALLSTCCQVYNEARLLPFKLNTLHFPCVYELLTIPHRFTPFQVCEIRRIHVTFDMLDFEGFLQAVQMEYADVQFCDLLPGVRNVDMSAKADPPADPSSWESRISRLWKAEERYRLLHAGMWDMMIAWMLKGCEEKVQVNCI